MRYRITFCKASLSSVILPPYNGQIAAWIYSTLRAANPVYADFLQNEGYSSDESALHTYRFFSFSALQAAHFKNVANQPGAIELLCDEVQLEVSFLSEQASVYFVQGLAASPLLRVGLEGSPVVFKVARIEGMGMPVFNNRELYHTCTPVVLMASQWQNEKLVQTALAPTDAAYATAVVANLLRKYKALTGRQLPADAVRFQCLSKPLSSAESKEAYSYNFSLQAPADVHRLLWLAGLGEKNMLGYGAIKQLTTSYGQMQQALQAMQTPLAPLPVAPALPLAPALHIAPALPLAPALPRHYSIAGTRMAA